MLLLKLSHSGMRNKMRIADFWKMYLKIVEVQTGIRNST